MWKRIRVIFFNGLSMPLKTTTMRLVANTQQRLIFWHENFVFEMKRQRWKKIQTWNWLHTPTTAAEWKRLNGGNFAKWCCLERINSRACQASICSATNSSVCQCHRNHGFSLCTNMGRTIGQKLTWIHFYTACTCWRFISLPQFLKFPLHIKCASSAFIW